MKGIRQFSITAEDKLGVLAELTRGLAYEGVNIRGISLAESRGSGKIRFVVDDPVKAERILTENNLQFDAAYVLPVELKNAPGALHSVAGTLAQNNVNIEYVYTLLPLKINAVVVFKVPEIEEAAQILENGGYKILDEDDLSLA